MQKSGRIAVRKLYPGHPHACGEHNGVSYDGNSGYLTSGNSASVSASIGWHHLAITCAGAYGATGSTVRAFVDGNLICSLPWGAPAGYLGLDSPGWFLLNTSVLPVTGIRFIDNQCLATSNFLPPSTAPNGTQACWSNSTTSLTGTCLFLSSAKATSSTVDVGIIDASSNLLTQCLILIPFRGRLVAFNTLEGQSLSTSINYPQRIRWAAIGTPFTTTSSIVTTVNANAWRCSRASVRQV